MMPVLIFLLTVTTGVLALDFKLQQVDSVRSESILLMDVNGDGLEDIVAGETWYKNPHWEPNAFRTLGYLDDLPINQKGQGFMLNDFDVAMDVNGDGRMDIVTGAWGKDLRWFENPAEAGSLWKAHVIDSREHTFHVGLLVDIDGDGKKQELITGKSPTAWYKPGQDEKGSPTLVRHVIDEGDAQWGYGAGDINGDGRTDVIRGDAWFEAPVDPVNGTWQKHCIALGYITGIETVFESEGECGKSEHVQQIYVMDVNGDGWNDIITGAAHTYGVFWYEQARVGDEIYFIQHIMDDTWSQAHALELVDLDGDGDRDLVTGRRWRGHGGNDPGGKDPNGLFWYEYTPEEVEPFKKHILSWDQGVGGGVLMGVGDLTGNGALDIVTTTKEGGPWIIEADDRNALGLNTLQAFNLNPAQNFKSSWFRVDGSKVSSTSVKVPGVYWMAGD